MEEQELQEQEVIQEQDIPVAGASEERFAQLLVEQRMAKEGAGELQELAARLSALQSKLTQVKEDVRREKVLSEIHILSQMASSTKEVYSSLAPGSKERLHAQEVLSRIISKYDAILDEHFK